MPRTGPGTPTHRGPSAPRRSRGPLWQNRAVTKARFHLTFPEHLISEPVIHRVSAEFGLVTNIRRANIEERRGWVILEMDGPEEAIARAVEWLASQGVQVDRIEA